MMTSEANNNITFSERSISDGQKEGLRIVRITIQLTQPLVSFQTSRNTVNTLYQAALSLCQMS